MKKRSMQAIMFCIGPHILLTRPVEAQVRLDPSGTRRNVGFVGGVIAGGSIGARRRTRRTSEQNIIISSSTKRFGR